MDSHVALYCGLSVEKPILTPNAFAFGRGHPSLLLIIHDLFLRTRMSELSLFPLRIPNSKLSLFMAT